MYKAGSKRKAAATEVAVPAKRLLDAPVPDEVLKTLKPSLNAAPLDVMALPCADVADRGRVLAVMAECHRQLNTLRIKRRGFSALAIGDLVIDVFLFVRRKELDTLQIVSRRFNAIIEGKMTLVCLRMLSSAKMERSGAKFVLVMVAGQWTSAEKMTRLRTHVANEAAATMLLFSACRSSRMHILELYGTTPMNGLFFDSLALCAPSIFLDEFRIGMRTLADGVADAKVHRALQTFAELKTVQVEPWRDFNLQNCLMRTCFKAGVALEVDLRPSLFDTYKCDSTAVEEVLLEWCFSTCDEQYATRERRLEISFPSWYYLKRDDFLQRWIEKAEAQSCRYKLTLRVTIQHSCMSQNTSALDDYKKGRQFDGFEDEVRFGSISGRRWKATYIVYADNNEDIVFEINH